ncbi:hypothetical protein K32_48940 [Kaistia sp. 32K]|uniref:NUDIX hydrolase n=1 Tax=Kaistia sp. 32K TaxID=2795690 RepID=UPI00191659B1|nr:NUDIX hydrolase [Kaistia sp. 32K]BCP56277.1 hypothetical protein K32_48940 [Kaistia sp. 32K]
MSSTFEKYQEHLAGVDLLGDPIDDLVKGHVKGYTKKNGTYVRPHARVGDAVAPDPIHHPRAGEDGKQVLIKQPHHASQPSTWHHPDAVATFVPGGDVPPSINGVPLRAWRDHPQTNDGWDFVDGQMDDLDEPPFHLPPGKKASSGVVIQEPDGRVWVIHPTNAFGGYEASLPKGTAEPDLSLQANSIKEVFEETGLKVEITGFLGDFSRTTSVARMYTGRRVGGSPHLMGWEAQAVSLCPASKLYDLLNVWSDHAIAEALGAGKPPSQ